MQLYLGKENHNSVCYYLWQQIKTNFSEVIQWVKKLSQCLAVLQRLK